MQNLTQIQKEFLIFAVENYGMEILEIIFGVPDEKDSVPSWALDEIIKIVRILEA